MNSNNNNSIGINSFVKRQIQGSGKTYSTLSFEEIFCNSNSSVSASDSSGGKVKNINDINSIKLIIILQ